MNPSEPVQQPNGPEPPSLTPEPKPPQPAFGQQPQPPEPMSAMSAAPTPQPPVPLQPPPEPLPGTSPDLIPPPQPEAPTAMPPVHVTVGTGGLSVLPDLPAKRPSKKPLFLVVGLVIVIGLAVGGFFGYKALAKQQNIKAAKQAADTFAHGLYDGDYEKVKTVYAGDDLTKEDIESSLAKDVFKDITHLDIEVGKHDGKDRAVAGYKLAFKEGQDTAFRAIYGDASAYYLLIMLQKDSGKWQVQTLVPSLVEPKISLHSYTSDSGLQGGSSADDVERETDIKALHGQVEAYYAQYGKYPTLAEINSKAFRAANMKGLDDDALKDPEGSEAELTARPAKHVYSYQKTGEAYTLTATREDGSLYTKKSLN